VTTSHLEAYSTWLEDREYAPRTQVHELITLKQIIGWLSESGNLVCGPKISLSVVKIDGTDTYCYTQEEVSAIAEYCLQNEKLRWLADVYIALATTGLRISELGSLRVSDYDRKKPETPVILLTDESSRAVRRIKAKRRETKSGRSRWFPVNPLLQPIIDRLSKNNEGRIFRGPHGGNLSDDVVRDNLVNKVLPALARRFPTPVDQIGFADGRLHSFRHYFCSFCANNGVPEAMVMQWLGHKDSKMIRHYYHLAESEAHKHMSRLRFVEITSEAVSQVVRGNEAKAVLIPEETTV